MPQHGPEIVVEIVKIVYILAENFPMAFAMLGFVGPVGKKIMCMKNPRL